MNPRVGKQRRGSWTEKVARVFDRWRDDFTVISNTFHHQKCHRTKIAKFGGIHIVRPLNWAVQLLKCRSNFFLRGSCGASAGAPSFFVCKAEARVQRPQASRKKTPHSLPLKAAAQQQRQALTLASGVAVPLTSSFANNDVPPILVAARINNIAASFETFPLLIIGKIVPFLILDG